MPRPSEPVDASDGATTKKRGAARRRTVLFRMLGAALGLFVGAWLAEAGLRIFDVGPASIVSKRHLWDTSSPARVDYHCYPTNPNGEFRPHPELSRGKWRLINYAKQDFPLARIDETPWCVEYRRSPQGMRDREYATDPPPGALRIVCVGDSFVFGEGVPVELGLVQQMRDRLGPDVELLNAGRSGATTAAEVVDLEFLVANYHAPRAILVFTANDIGLTEALDRRQNHIHDLVTIRDLHLYARSWYASRWRLLRFLGSYGTLRRITRETIDWYLDCYDPRYNAENLAAFADRLRGVAALPDCRVVLVLYPLLESLERDYPLAPIHRRVGEIARQAGLPVLDLAPVFAGQRTSGLWVHPTDHHPNSKGHAIAAEAIVAWLARDVPGFLNEGAPTQPAGYSP